MDAKKRQGAVVRRSGRQYDRFRPSYPRAALEWAVGGPPPRRVVDLGAGTGILTRGTDRRRLRGDPGRARSGNARPTGGGDAGRTALAGSAEDIPLPDGSVDAVVAGQAYHWFDPELAHAEAARVLRPGGYFAADLEPA